MTNTLARGLAKLKAMRVELQPRPRPAGRGGWSTELARHLHQIVWMKSATGRELKDTTATARIGLVAEYERLEAEGAFREQAR
jgi:hypothetical protein